MENKVWLITGTSSGFGKVWAKAALDRGDKVVATVRNESDNQDLIDAYGDNVLSLILDVTDRKACFETVKKAVAHFGRIDVLINNAGYGQFGYMEELSEEDVKLQMDVNVNGSIWMIQAVLPTMRNQKSGNIIQVSSIGGLVSYPGIGMYHASKWAVEGICESLSQEVAHFGVKVTLVEPGGYQTDFASRSGRTAKPMEEYDFPREERKKSYGKPSIGDPQYTAKHILNIADSESPPLRVLMGKKPWTVLKPRYEERMKSWEENMDITIDSHGPQD